MYWVVPAAAVAIMLGLILVGAARALIEAAGVNRSLAHVREHPVLAMSTGFARESERVSAATDAAQREIARIRESIAAIGEGLRDLRAPQVVAAVRILGLALRALGHLH